MFCRSSVIGLKYKYLVFIYILQFITEHRSVQNKMIVAIPTTPTTPTKHPPSPTNHRHQVKATYYNNYNNSDNTSNNQLVVGLSPCWSCFLCSSSFRVSHGTELFKFFISWHIKYTIREALKENMSYRVKLSLSLVLKE